MKNINVRFDKPYGKDNEYKVKITFEAEFDNEMEALNFHSDLNKQIIHYKEQEAMKDETKIVNLDKSK